MAIKYYNYKLAAGVSRIAMFNSVINTRHDNNGIFPGEKAVYNLDRLITF